MTSRRPIPLEDLSPQVEKLCEVLNGEDDLPCALISASFLDECLASMLEKRMIKSSIVHKIFGISSWLGTYGARTELAYCLGMVSKGLYQNLGKIGEIRNQFAHSHLEMSFANKDAQRLCSELTLPKVSVAFSVQPEAGAVRPLWPGEDDPRSRFTTIVLVMANRLLLTGLGAERLPRQEKGWE